MVSKKDKFGMNNGGHLSWPMKIHHGIERYD
jgi:hypothetical protein